MDQKTRAGASLEPTASKAQRTKFSPARKHIVDQTDKSRAGAQILTPNSTMIAIAESAADKAGEEQGDWRWSHGWELAKQAALFAIVETTERLSKAASTANISVPLAPGIPDGAAIARRTIVRSEEHTSELQSLMRISYAVFCLNNKHNSKPYIRIKPY